MAKKQNPSTKKRHGRRHGRRHGGHHATALQLDVTMQTKQRTILHCGFNKTKRHTHTSFGAASSLTREELEEEKDWEEEEED